MRVFIATPAPPGTRLGNRITALRWQVIMRSLCCRVRIGPRWETKDRCDVLVAIHATKSADSIQAFRKHHPFMPIIVGLAGTDLYVDLGRNARTRTSIKEATRLVVLQKAALRRLDAVTRRKTRVILQSAIPYQGRVARRRGRFAVVAVGHLRPIKDPLLAAEAARLLPVTSRISIEHYGSSLDAELATAARIESRHNPRWNWRGERSHAEVSRILAASDVFIQTSIEEGGSSAIAEAVVAGLPILSTRNDGAIGMLGKDHRGFFAAGDARALADLLTRCERDDEFLRELREASRLRAPLFAPERERDAWQAILRELGLRS